MSSHNVKEELLKTLPVVENFIQNSQLLLSSQDGLISLLRENFTSKYIVVYLVHHFHAWYAVSDLYSAMHKSSDFLPVVISIPHGFGNTEVQGERKVHEFLTKEGIPHIRFNFEDQFKGLHLLKIIRPDIVVRQEPWGNSTPPAYHTHNLTFTRLLYTDYGIEIFDGLYGWKHYRTPLHYKAWMILCVNEVQKKYYVSQNPELKSLYVTGYPKYDVICQRMKEGSFWPVKKPQENKFRIIYAPHHTVTNVGPSFATFPEAYKTILHLATSLENIEIVFRPHPELLERPAPDNCPQLKEMLAHFITEWNKLSNTGISMDGDYALLFAASDCLVTDGISFLGEYPLTGKPCIFLENKRHWPLNIIGEECLSSSYRVTDIERLGELIRELAQEKEEGKKDSLFKQREKVMEFLRPYPGQASERALHFIRNKLDEEK